MGTRPSSPGYVFVRLEPDDGSWSTIRYLPGVRSLVEIGGGPCPVADEIVEAIRERVTGWLPGPARLQAGDRVAVVSGIFADLEGIFCEVLSGAERVTILLDIMRRQVRLEEGLVYGGDDAFFLTEAEHDQMPRRCVRPV
jgi:transcription antitermination factor NusG